jgi:hypothetical protein
MSLESDYHCLHDHLFIEVSFVVHSTYKISAPSTQRMPSLLTVCPLYHRTYNIYIHMHIGEHASQVTSEIIITSSGLYISLHCTGKFENKL